MAPAWSPVRYGRAGYRSKAEAPAKLARRAAGAARRMLRAARSRAVRPKFSGSRANAEPGRDLDEIGYRPSHHLAHHLAPVRLHRNLADVQLGRDLLVQAPRDDEHHDVDFAACKRCITITKRRHLRLATKLGAADLERTLDSAQ